MSFRNVQWTIVRGSRFWLEEVSMKRDCRWLLSAFLFAAVVVPPVSAMPFQDVSEKSSVDSSSKQSFSADVEGQLWKTLLNDQNVEITYIDDFRENRLQQFDLQGDVQWTPGVVSLAPGSSLTGRVVMGAVCDVEFTLKKNEDVDSDAPETWMGVIVGKDMKAGVLIGPAADEKSVELRSEKASSQIQLKIMTQMKDSETGATAHSLVRSRTIDDSPDGRWLLRYNCGVIEVWHEGQRLLSADCGLGDLALSAIEISQQKNSVALTHVQLAAENRIVPPAFDDPSERQKLIADWQELAPKSSQLLKDRKLPEYLESVRLQADLEEKIFGRKSLIPLRTRGTLALVLETTEQLKEALTVYDELVAVCRERLGARHPHVAQLLVNRQLCRDKLNLPQPEVDELPGAIAVLEEVLAEGDPATLIAIGGYVLHLQQRGRLRDAEKWALHCVELCEGVNSNESRDLLGALGELARVQGLLGKVEEEINTRKRITSLCRLGLGEVHPETNQSRELLSDAFRNAGDLRAARQLLEENLQIQSANGVDGTLAAVKTLGKLSRIALDLRDLDAALRFAEESVAVAKSNAFDFVVIAEAQLNLVDVRVQRQDLDGARKLLQDICSQDRTGGRREQQILAHAFEELSVLSFREGDFPSAVTQTNRAIELFRSANRLDAFSEARLRERLGLIFFQKHDVELAEIEFRKSLSLHEAAADVESDDLPRSWGYLAMVAEHRKDWDLAITLGEKALNHRERQFGVVHRETADALKSLATTYQLQNRWAEAADLDLRSLRIRLQLMQKLLQGLSETEALTSVRELYETRSRLIEKYRITRALPRAEVEQQLVSVPEIDDSELYEIVSQTKGIATRGLAMRRIAATDSTEAKAIWKTLTKTRRELAELALADTHINGQEREKRLTELTDAKERLERELVSAAPRFRDDGQLQPFSCDDLVSVLPPDVAIVDFVRCTTPASRIANQENAATDYYEAFVLRRPFDSSSEAVRWVHLGAGGDIEAAVSAWRHSGGSRGATIDRDTAAAASWEATGQQLRTLIWDKLSPHLQGITTVLIIPDGSLARVPWGALPGKRPGTFLLEDLAIGTIQNPQQAVSLLRSAAPAGRRLLVIGGVDYDHRSESFDETISSSVAGRSKPGDLPHSTGGERQSRGAQTGGKRLQWESLPGTAKELELIAELGSTKFDVNRLGAEKATEVTVESLLPSCRYIHFATHGYFADEILRSPLYDQPNVLESLRAIDADPVFKPRLESRHPLLLTGLILSGANMLPTSNADAASFRDGILTGEEIVQIDLSNTELVTLSACETGLGVVADGEGVLGLQRAFATAGARTVVASLWKVDDRATQALMTEFYRNMWNRNLSKIEALRQAQITMLKRYDVATGELRPDNPKQNTDASILPPYFWAGFLMNGDWR